MVTVSGAVSCTEDFRLGGRIGGVPGGVSGNPPQSAAIILLTQGIQLVS